MEHISIKDLAVPISEYAAVRIGTTLLDAIWELEKAQEAFTSSKYQHRAILVLDQEDTVVGKIGQLRILKAVETGYEINEELERLKSYNFSEAYIAGIQEKRRLDAPILTRESLCAAAEMKVEEFMQQPTPDECVSEDSSIDIAIHRLVAGTHLSLLVTRDTKIVGVLRIADVFAAVFHEMQFSGVGK